MGFACGCDEYNTFQSVTTPRARKAHKCCECRQEIKPGDVYVRRFWVYDGYSGTDKICERCDDLMAAFADVGYCWYTGEFLSSYAEWLDEEGKQRPQWLNEIIKPPLRAAQ